ncbi:hypothetical protein KVR01_012698 [Diaporthe batatas]|uniref:uncharacterized protein n=1 Tax=Diaporthe batatas TaxID=748121 RepID=UPI001D059050|nr:uncharacterized protein KVR01_012698 [Diaporthe batatas]KAG8157314.1 hypothetical protein KVR01_012698 [Diaporthe batatas]
MSSASASENDAKQLLEPWEGWIRCQTCKHHHYGLNGAAGLLLVRRDETKASRPFTHVVLQHRSYNTMAGGTWGIPGGALGTGEDPVQGALREASEEVGLPQDCAGGLDPVIAILGEKAFMNHGVWKYTTVFAEVLKQFEPSVPQGDWESLEVKWVAFKDVEKLPLHPEFGDAWPRMKSILNCLAGATKR